jgi:hypothetical protein
MSQAGVMSNQQQHAENPWIWLLRKAADFCLSPLKMVPVVGGLFKFLEDKQSNQLQQADFPENYGNTSQIENALKKASPIQEYAKRIYGAAGQNTANESTQPDESITDTTLSADELAAFQANKTDFQDR